METTWELLYFTNASGKRPVFEFIASLDDRTEKSVREVLYYFEKYGFHLETKYLRRFKNYKKLWELRVVHNGNQYRFILAKVLRNKAVLLHAFMKKSQKTPVKELKTAQKRLEIIEHYA